jgi:hypothetical protein
MRRYGVESEAAARESLGHLQGMYRRGRDPAVLDELNKRHRLLGMPEIDGNAIAAPPEPAPFAPQMPNALSAQPRQAPQQMQPPAQPMASARPPMQPTQQPRTGGFSMPLAQAQDAHGVLPPPPTDMAKVDRNLAKLFAKKAPDADISAYLQHEGVTLDQVTKYKDERKSLGVGGRLVADVSEFVGNAPRNVYNYFAGEEDPRNRKVGDKLLVLVALL